MSANKEHGSVNSGVTDELLVTIADKFHTQHLQNFATTLIGLDAAEYDEILKDAGDDPAKQGIQASSYFVFFCVLSLRIS